MLTSPRPRMYNYMSDDEMNRFMSPRYGSDFTFNMHGLTVFLCNGDIAYHSYSVYARGKELVVATYNTLDLTPLGRQEEGA